MPKISPDEVERELATLGEPWLVCDWSTLEDSRHDDLSREQAEILRRTLLQLGAEIRIRKGEIRIIGRLSLGAGTTKIGVKANALRGADAPLKHPNFQA
ncbi:MAG: hypothetical protein FJ025_00935 [Chloroflexi bacterium]|nr:hypothetical protein [Chloroflexota bacterium]